MTRPILFITGTDTGVGKTIVTAALTALLAGRASGSLEPSASIAVDKPVQTGVSLGEPAAVAVISRLAGRCVISEGIRLRRPMAPVPAARDDDAALPTIEEHANRIRKLAAHCDRVLVEGAGGLLVQLDDAGRTLAELASELGDDAAVIVVCRSGLGTLNHTELTLEALRRRGLFVAGIVIGSWPEHPDDIDLDNSSYLSSLDTPLLGAIPENASLLDPEVFRADAVRWFDTSP